MVICTFQQYGIPEPVAQPQVYTNRGEDICQHSFTRSIYSYFSHATVPPRRGILFYR